MTVTVWAVEGVGGGAGWEDDRGGGFAGAYFDVGGSVCVLLVVGCWPLVFSSG